MINTLAFYDSTKKGVGVHLSLKTILLSHSIPDVLKINLEDGEKMLKNWNDILIGQMFGHFNGFLYDTGGQFYKKFTSNQRKETRQLI